LREFIPDWEQTLVAYKPVFFISFLMNFYAIIVARIKCNKIDDDDDDR